MDIVANNNKFIMYKGELFIYVCVQSCPPPHSRSGDCLKTIFISCRYPFGTNSNHQDYEIRASVFLKWTTKRNEMLKEKQITVCYPLIWS